MNTEQNIFTAFQGKLSKEFFPMQQRVVQIAKREANILSYICGGILLLVVLIIWMLGHRVPALYTISIGGIIWGVGFILYSSFQENRAIDRFEYKQIIPAINQWSAKYLNPLISKRIEEKFADKSLKSEDYVTLQSRLNRYAPTSSMTLSHKDEIILFEAFIYDFEGNDQMLRSTVAMGDKWIKKLLVFKKDNVWKLQVFYQENARTNNQYKDFTIPLLSA